MCPQGASRVLLKSPFQQSSETGRTSPQGHSQAPDTPTAKWEGPWESQVEDTTVVTRPGNAALGSPHWQSTDLKADSSLARHRTRTGAGKVGCQGPRRAEEGAPVGSWQVTPSASPGREIRSRRGVRDGGLCRPGAEPGSIQRTVGTHSWDYKWK